jgi:ATP-dependent DNA ligase
LSESVKEGKYVCLADSVEKKGEEYYKVVVANGLEGVVAKKKDSTYMQGLRGDSWLKIKPLLVCEVAYQSVTRDNSLRAPRFLHMRIDKKPSECTIDQLALKN